jgi:hypothetical protein
MASREDAARRMDQARQITDNPLFREALDALQESLKRQRLTVKPTDTDGHTKLILAEQILGQFEHYLQRTISDGATAQMQMIAPTLRERIFAR